MKRKKNAKRPINFCARLPLILVDQVEYKRVLKRDYDRLSPEDRVRYSGSAPYYQIVKIPPYPNPSVERLRNKLVRQRVLFVETETVTEDRAFVSFQTLGADLV